LTTLVVPLRLTRAPASRTDQRLARLLRTVPSGCKAIVVDDTASDSAAAATGRTVAGFAPRARYLRHRDTAAAPFSIGRLRDVGAAAAPDGLVLFHDVDFFAPPGIYRRLDAALAGPLGRELAGGGFLCLPVAFLSRLGTVAARRIDERRWSAIASPWARRVGLVDRLVMASSAMVVDRRVLLAHGGHSTAFTGHGAEDFELMHRLALSYPRGPRPPDYHVDYGARGADRGGFRAYFARYAAPLAAEGLHLAHAWHPRREEDPRYYAEQKRNFARLEAQLLASMRDEQASIERSDAAVEDGPRCATTPAGPNR